MFLFKTLRSIFSSSVHWKKEKPRSSEPQEQRAELAPRSWFLKMMPQQKESGMLGEMAGSKAKADKILSDQTNGGKGKRGEKGAGGEESIKEGNALL